ncbi:MAG TPA: hypothetical protein VL179_05500, partial [Mycobacterium sp.]|nr:hypothetical protein [Mycobacterium sp.]
AIGAALSVAGNVVATPKKARPPAEPPPFPEAMPPVEPTPPPSDSAPEVVLQPLITPPPPPPPPPPRPAPVSPRPSAAPEPEDNGGRAVVEWYRRPIPVVLLAALVAMLLGVVAVLVLRHAADGDSDSGVLTTVSTTTTSPSPTFEPPPAFAPPPVLAPHPEPAPPAIPEAPVYPEHPAPETTEVPVAP